MMNNKAFVVIDIQNDITKHYREIIGNINLAIEWAVDMAKAGFTVHVLSDCITSYDLKKLPEMLSYYENKGCEVKKLIEYR
jgi:nicotinamidase-related amidase